MKARIYLVTKLHSGISGAEKYSGDVSNFAAGRNGFSAAIRAVQAERKSNRLSFGGEGAGGSWLELRDHTGYYRLNEFDEMNGIDLNKTASDLNAKKAALAAEMKALQDMESAAFDAGLFGRPMPRQFDKNGITPYEVERGYRNGKAQAAEFSDIDE